MKDQQKCNYKQQFQFKKKKKKIRTTLVWELLSCLEV